MHLTQDAAIKLVESIGSTLGLERVNDVSGVSYYAITQDTAVRISDHSTHLQTWVDKGTYTKKNKYSIVIEVNPSKPVLAVQPGIGTFVVTEFKHKLRGLSDDAVLVLANAIKGAIGTGGQFSNPLRVKPKMLASTQLNDLKTNKNMKNNTIKLNEVQLRQIIAESVKKVLKEYDNNEYAWNTYDKDTFNKPPRKWDEEEKPYRDALTRLYKALYYFMEEEPEEVVSSFSDELYNMAENLFLEIGDRLGY